MKSIYILLLFFPFIIFAQVDINTASIEELDSINGIGPVLAQRIIDTRPFSSIDDLIKVNGIGTSVLEKIKDQGLAYVSSQEAEEVRPLKAYPDIFITEIMPSPEGDDMTGEYFKLKNENDFEVDLSGWKIEDTIGTPKTYTLDQKISPFETLVLYRQKTNITLNNSGDGLRLIDPAGTVKDAVDFGKAEAGISYIKTADGWQWNTPARPKTIEPGSAPLPTAKEIVPTKANIIEIEAINLSSEKPPTPVIFIAIFTSAFLAGFFLYLKKKIG